ncbi:aspartate-alanine antiporter-like transporter [Shewanella colwelliana]|uniref:aspartate-alanine antiporter-like transporter n=1 Tax=Shewanella colwelliana TaxID=23 RepID=UPI00373700DE
METLQHILNVSPYFPILITLVLGVVVGKIAIGRFALGSIVGTLLVGMVIGQVGVAISPSIRWIFFGLFMYVVGYQGGYQLINTLQLRKKSILLASVSMSVIAMVTLAIACWLFELDLFMAIGMTAGSFVHPEIINVATDAIEQLPGLTDAAKRVAQSEVNMGYMLTVIFGVLAPVIMMTWLLPVTMKWTSSSVSSRSDSLGDHDQQLAGQESINTSQNVVRRVFEVNKQSTVVGKTIEQLNAPSIDVIFELSRVDSNDTSDKDGELIVAGDIITITGRHHTLFYFDDNVLGTELPCDTQSDVSEESCLMLINIHDFVGQSLQEIKTDINQHTHRAVCITQLIRDKNLLDLTPELTVKQHDIVQITGSLNDVKIAKNSFGPVLNLPGNNQSLFGIGLVLAYLISMWHLNIGGLYFYFSLGLSSLASGIAVGWACHKLNPLDLLPEYSTNCVRDIALLAFTAVTGLHFGPLMIEAMNVSGVEVSLIGCGVVLISQLISFVIAYRIFNIRDPIELMGSVSGSQHSGIGMSTIYRQGKVEGAIYAVAVSYITSSFLMLITVSMILKFM